MSKPTIDTTSDAPCIHNYSKREPWGATGLVGKVLQRLKRYYQKLFMNRNYVFINHGPFEPVIAPFCDIERYNRFEDVPDHVWKTVESHGGQNALLKDRREMEQDSVMWAAFVDGRLAGVVFTRRGRNFNRWFLELQDDDIVIFRGRTYPEFRGRGICPTLERYSMHISLSQGEKAYTDCNINNKPSIRCIQKAGFELIATMKPITREEALGGDR